MDYIEVYIALPTEAQEIISAELAELGYESFLQEERALKAYITRSAFQENHLANLKQEYQDQIPFDYTHQVVEAANWNARWEASFEPVIVEDQCIIKSSFHQVNQSYPYEITINPKMSFGTGHHETTQMMVEHQLQIPHQGKRVMDVGCGTAVLAILATKLGAQEVIAFDTDEWAYNNSQENILVNQAEPVRIFWGNIQEVLPLANRQASFEIILANINRNVLLEEIPIYEGYLSPGGSLVLSGFYQSDFETIHQLASRHHLSLAKQILRNRWMSLRYTKEE